MHDHDNISDQTPIADAFEQEQETPDWQEQRQEVADADSDDRDEYRAAGPE